MYQPAHYGKRVVAALLDYGLVLTVGFGLGMLGGILLIAAGFGIVIWLITPLFMLLAGLWNSVFRQGRTGQSIGKTQQNISIIRLDTGGVPGAGWMLLRGLIFWFFNTVTGGIFLIVDYLFPVWDKNGQRVVDKMLKFQVIDGISSGSGMTFPPPLSTLSNDPFA